MNVTLLFTTLAILTERLLVATTLKNASLPIPVVLFVLRIAETPGVARITLERELGVGVASANSSLRWLTDAGLVRWEFAEDQRTKKLFLTAEGEALFEGLDGVTVKTPRPDDIFHVPSSAKHQVRVRKSDGI